jgi:Purple acid Phosphatase, N-terminal domain/Calcineurin-like phosphoesterase
MHRLDGLEEAMGNRIIAGSFAELFRFTIAGLLVFCFFSGSVRAEDKDLPVMIPEAEPCKDVGVRNPKNMAGKLKITTHPTLAGKGLLIDLGDPAFFGKIYTGPYPFESQESDYDYVRFGKFRKKRDLLKRGKGLLPASAYFATHYNANDWPTEKFLFVGTIAYRLDLWKKGDKGRKPEYFGYCGGRASFRRVKDANGRIKYEKNVTIIDGPFVSMLTSDDPTSAVIAWNTDKESTGKVIVYRSKASSIAIKDSEKKASLGESREFSSEKAAKKHEVKVSGLDPNARYFYTVRCETAKGQEIQTKLYGFRTPPKKGHGAFSFAYAGDGREGTGGAERTYMGHNLRTLSMIARSAYRNGAEFFLFGGDLVNGYTSNKADFALQLRSWKQALSGFWRSKPVYPAMGNHETLMNSFSYHGICHKYGLGLDKWPYPTDSAEAVFASEFYNPTNGPKPSDTRRPTYKENVYTFQYGPLLTIAFNNNYWYTAGMYDRRKRAFSGRWQQTYGGAPEGYIMEDQLQWIEEKLKKAEKAPTVKYVILYAQEPPFPCGGHIMDAMWYKGDNNIRAYTKDRTDNEVKPEKMGIIEVRNRLWKAVANCSKVAAVLSGDEHAYHRVLISDRTPVGIPGKDDPNGDGQLENCFPDGAKCSSNPDFRYPTWQIVVGTAGAPYYAIENTPWKSDVAFYSSQSGYSLFNVDNDTISMKFISETGQILDVVEDLMAVKREAAR